MLKSKGFWALFFFCFLIILTRVLLVPIDDIKGGRTFWRGDDYSEKGSVSASHYWHDYGYWETKFRPMYGYVQGDKASASAYLHYPPIADLITSVYIGIFGSDLRVARIPPMVLSLIFMIVLALLLQFLFKDPKLALLSLLLTLPANYFLAWADNLYSHMLSEFSKVAFVAVLYLHYNGKKTWGPILPLALASVLLANISLHLIVYCAFTAVGFSMFYRTGIKRIFALENILLGAGFVSGLALHVYLNRLYLGSWEATLADIRSIFHVRGVLPLAEKLELPWTAVNRIERYFLIPGWALLVFFVYFLKSTVARPDLQKLSWILLVSGLAWYAVMPQHASVHSYMTREMGLFILLVSGIGVSAYAANVKAKWKLWGWPLKSLNVLFLVYVVAMAITQQVLPMWLKHGLSRWFT